ncbi:MAG: hypothetical protein CMM58_12715 [Rhodospirillaceae bacterium]|nr:hypothetical protein [Rhodospirillaceae bacterium]|tara:strand:+ start:1873 stop:2280 length:408 start_codon:yes stop_codon:yes gene_type:complete
MGIMTTEIDIELNLLVWAVGLAFIQVVLAIVGAVSQLGLTTLAGNRENLPSTVGWVARAQRAHRNMLENLVLFAALVIITKLAGASNEMTVLGSQLFFWGRAAYAVIYIVGIPWIRTGAYVISIVGLIMIFLQLI